MSDLVPYDLTIHQKKKFIQDVKFFFWDETYIYQSCADGITRHCVAEIEMLSVLEVCHSFPVGWHHSGI